MSRNKFLKYGCVFICQLCFLCYDSYAVYSAGSSPEFYITSSTVWAAPDGTANTRTTVGLGEVTNIYANNFVDRDVSTTTSCDGTTSSTDVYDDMFGSRIELWENGSMVQAIPYASSVSLVATTVGTATVKVYKRDKGLYYADTDGQTAGDGSMWDVVETKSITAIAPSGLKCTAFTDQSAATFPNHTSISTWGSSSYEFGGFKWTAHVEVQPTSVCFQGIQIEEVFNPDPLYQDAFPGVLYLNPSATGRSTTAPGIAGVNADNIFYDVLHDPLTPKPRFSATNDPATPGACTLNFPSSSSGTWDVDWKYGSTLSGTIVSGHSMISDYNANGGGRVQNYLGKSSGYVGPWKL